MRGRLLARLRRRRRLLRLLLALGALALGLWAAYLELVAAAAAAGGGAPPDRSELPRGAPGEGKAGGGAQPRSPAPSRAPAGAACPAREPGAVPPASRPAGEEGVSAARCRGGRQSAAGDRGAASRGALGDGGGFCSPGRRWGSGRFSAFGLSGLTLLSVRRPVKT